MYKKMRTIILALRLAPYFIYCYFAWIRRYSSHPEKYPFDVRYARVKKLAKVIVKVFKLDFKVAGLDYLQNAKKPFLGISNHRDFTDPILFIHLLDTPVSFVAKKEAYKLPFVGRVLRAFDGFFIDRDDIMSQVRVFKDISKRLQNGDVSYFVFPEGTRLKDHSSSILPYKDGSLKPAYWANTDIINFAHYGTDFILTRKPKGVKKREIYLTCFAPIKYQDFKDKTTTEVMPHFEQESRAAVLTMANAYQKKNLS